MDGVAADELRGRFFGLLVRIEDRLSATTTDLLHELIDAGDFGLALEREDIR